MADLSLSNPVNPVVTQVETLGGPTTFVPKERGPSCASCRKMVQIVLWPVQAFFGVAAQLTKDVSGLRALAGSIQGAIEFADLMNLPVKSYSVLQQTCKSFQNGVAGLSVIGYAAEFASRKAFQSYNYCMSRICFLAASIFKGVEFLENMAIVAAGTANAWAQSIFKTSAQSIMPALNLAGWIFDGSHHIDRYLKRPNLDSGLAIGTAAAKFISIALTGVASRPLKFAKIAATVGAGLITVVRAGITYAKQQAASAA